MGIFITWIIFCVVAGYVGDTRKIGFWAAFAWSLFLSPLVDLIIAFASDKKGMGQKVSPAMSKLVFEGDKLFKGLDYDRAIEKYLSALKYSDTAPLTNFKLAKLYSLKRDGANSLKHLVNAVQSGFKDFDKIHCENDLTHLRSLQEFKTYFSNSYKMPTVISETNRVSKTDELEKLAGLLEKGVLTKQEFENEKRKILG